MLANTDSRHINAQKCRATHRENGWDNRALIRTDSGRRGRHGAGFEHGKRNLICAQPKVLLDFSLAAIRRTMLQRGLKDRADVRINDQTANLATLSIIGARLGRGIFRRDSCLILGFNVRIFDPQRPDFASQLIVHFLDGGQLSKPLADFGSTQRMGLTGEHFSGPLAN